MGADFYTNTFDSTTILVTVSTALTFYNALELILLIFTTFTAYRGLLFLVITDLDFWADSI